MLSVHSDLTTPTMQKQKNRLNRNGPSWLEAVHGGRLDDTNSITTNDFSEALGGLVVFIDPEVNSWGPLVDETDCLKSSGSLVSLQPRSLSSGAGYCHFLWRLRCASLGKKVGYYLASPTRREPRQERCNSASEADASVWSLLWLSGHRHLNWSARRTSSIDRCRLSGCPNEF
jgi:hypothetical protein